MAEVVIIRARDPDQLKEFLEESFGLQFKKETQVPFQEDHWYCVRNGKILEIHATNLEDARGMAIEAIQFL